MHKRYIITATKYWNFIIIKIQNEPLLTVTDPKN
jgi:hypothetical protein